MMRPRSSSIALTVAVLVLAPCGSSALAQLRIPRVPPRGLFTRDYAAILTVRAVNTIGQAQREAFEAHDTPIIVVTVPSMAKYGGGGYSIERFANEWFDKWQIGKRGPDGELINQGILFLISSGDRKARIELGADWERRWDAYCARIMSEVIVPAFKEGDYSAGTVAGVEALRGMAELGPESSPPFDLKKALQSRPVKTSPLPLWGIGLMLIGGVALIALSFVMPQHRKWLLIVGIGLIVAAVLFWIVLVVLGLLAKRRVGGSRGGFASGGGFASSGGFSSGGFSGGGGASGSW